MKVNQNTNLKELHEDVDDDNTNIDLEKALGILGVRECEVLRLIGNGYTAVEASIELSISVHTVRTHVKAIKRKLKLEGHRSLIYWYRINGKSQD